MGVNSVTRTILQDTEKNVVHNVSILPKSPLDPGSLWDEEFPVLIAGAGPSGLLEAYLLSCLGIKSLVIERYPKRLDAPKAHALSPRSMEIARQFGLDTNFMRSQGTSRTDAYWVNFVTNLSGRHIGRLHYERMDADVLDVTPETEMIHNIPQPDFEAIVADALANDPNVEIRKNMSYISCTQDQDGVTTEVEDRGAGNTFRVRSRHLIACDGAKSRVRSSLGIESEGENAYETMMTIHFDADLRPVVGENVGMLHWVIDPEVSGFIISYDLSDNQVLICNFDSEKHPLESWDEELCRKTVKAAIGRDNVPFNVLSFRPWVLSRKVANSYRVGNVFLAGDAAHSFPPTGGLGLNSGLADVHNLAYKIAAVHHGWGSSKLLDSYEDDRRHVALVNSAQSIKNGIKIFKMLKTFGLNNPDIEVARANLFKSIDDPCQKILIDEGVEGQQEHFDNLELHIGYVYGSKIYPSNASHYTPQYIQGARLPHVWIKPLSQTALEILPQPVDVSYVSELTAQEVATKRYSSLDLCSHDAFTVLVSSRPEKEFLDEVAPRSGKVLVPVNILVLERDFEIVPSPNSQTWLQNLMLLEGGGVVVRPDQHILSVFESQTTGAEVSQLIKQHLGI